MNINNLPYKLGISGTLKKKTINFYREKIIDYNENGILTDQAFLNKYGILFVNNFFLQQELINRRNTYIKKANNYIINISTAKFKDNNILKLINNTIVIINKMPNKYNYALLEALAKIILKATTKSIKDDLTFFNELLTFLNYNSINQIDLDFILAEFIKNPQTILKALIYNLNDLKIKTFKIDPLELSIECQEILFLGEFIAPERVKNVANNLYNATNLMHYILPIYFLITSSSKAEQFLHLSRHLEEDELFNKASLYTNNNIIKLVRKKYDFYY